MNQKVEARLREALGEAAGTVDAAKIRPLVAPRRRTSLGGSRLRRPAVVVAGAAVAVVAVAGGVTFFWPAARQAPEAASANGTVLAAQTGSTVGDIAVFLCNKTSPYPACRDGSTGRAATPAEIDAVGRMLRTRPEVESVTFEDRRTAYENFKRMYHDNKVILDATRVDDMVESYRVHLTPGADPRPLIEAAKAMPGVSTVIDQRCVERAKKQADQAKRTGGTPPATAC